MHMEKQSLWEEKKEEQWKQKMGLKAARESGENLSEGQLQKLEKRKPENQAEEFPQ